jgi:flagellar basal-body rod protein FlgB
MSNKLNIFDALKINMAHATKRQEILVGNISRANMPKAKAMEVAPLNFEDLLKRKTTNMSITHPRHLSSRITNSNFKTIKDTQEYEVSMSGNNIDLVEQTKKLADNNANYQTVTNTYRKLMSLLKMTIGGK